MSLIASIQEYLRSRAAVEQKGAHTNFKAKAYPRMPQIALPDPEEISMSLSNALAERRSTSARTDSRAIALSDVSSILAGLRLRADGSRPYPSGGGLYPIETYLVAREIEGIGTRIFHYRPDLHALEDLWAYDGNKSIFSDEVNAEWWRGASAFIIFTALWDKSAQKYGDFGYYLSLLEAGHAAQNILLAAAALDIGARPLARFDDDAVIKILDIDPERERPIYAITLTKEN